MATSARKRSFLTFFRPYPAFLGFIMSVTSIKGYLLNVLIYSQLLNQGLFHFFHNGTKMEHRFPVALAKA